MEKMSDGGLGCDPAAHRRDESVLTRQKPRTGITGRGFDI